MQLNITSTLLGLSLSVHRKARLCLGPTPSGQRDFGRGLPPRTNWPLQGVCLGKAVVVEADGLAFFTPIRKMKGADDVGWWGPTPTGRRWPDRPCKLKDPNTCVGDFDGWKWPICLTGNENEPPFRERFDLSLVRHVEASVYVICHATCGNFTGDGSLTTYRFYVNAVVPSDAF